MVKICLSGRRTRHVDVKDRTIRDKIDEGVVHVENVRSEEQHADILAEALGVKTVEKHARFFLIPP